MESCCGQCRNGVRDAAGSGVGTSARERGWRSQFETAGFVDRAIFRNRWAQAADVRNAVLRAGAGIWHGDLCGTEESAGAPQHAGNIGADLRDLQDLPDHAGQVPDAAVGVYCRGDRAVFRRAAEVRSVFARADHSCVQRAGHRGKLRRGVVRHSREHVRELAHGVCGAARQAVSDLPDSAASGHEHRHDADQRGTADDAGDSAVRSWRIMRARASSDSPSANRWARRRCASRAESSPRSRTSART